MASTTKACENEVWRPIPGYEGFYEASNRGRIRGVRRKVKHWRGGFAEKSPKILSQNLGKHSGRYAVSLSKNGKVVSRQVHVLVCAAFHGPRPKGLECAHLDGDRENNFADNLKWCTKLENEWHKVLHGTLATGIRNGSHTQPHRRPRGERHGCSRLTEEQVMEIRRTNQREKVGCNRLARLVGVTPAQIKNILSNRHWREQ